MSATSYRALLDDVIITDELDRRPSRQPDHEAENQALNALADAMSSNPGGMLQRLVEAAMELTNSDSAGVSLLEPGGEQGTFCWVATAGAWSPYSDGTMLREESPCGEVVARESILLMDRPERAFPALLQAQPGIGEGLLAPFNIDGAPAGTLWTLKHGQEGRFDAEGARLLTSLGEQRSVRHSGVNYPAYPMDAGMRYVPGLDLYLSGTYDGGLHWLTLYEDFRGVAMSNGQMSAYDRQPSI